MVIYMFDISNNNINFLKRNDVIEFISSSTSEFSPYIKSGDKFIVERNIPIRYSLPIILSGNDITMLDFSNEQLKLYPTSIDTIYQILISFKSDNNFILQPMIPSGKYLYRLEEPTMFPSINDPNKITIGEIKPYDSPYPDYKIELITLKDFEPFIMNVINTNSETDKITFEFIINKLKVNKIDENITPNKVVYHYDMYQW